MRVAVVAPRSVPYVFGGAERHWNSLVVGLQEAGHDAELVTLDSPESTFAEVLTSYRAFLDLDLSRFDVVISGKYPSWMVEHPRHIRHLNHPLRGLYERYPGHLPDVTPELEAKVAEQLEKGPRELIEWALRQSDQSFPGPVIRSVVQALDCHAAERISVHATVSEHVARRPGYVPQDADVAVIAPLTDLAGGSHTLPPSEGKHFLSYGRLTPIKRFDMTIKAFKGSGQELLLLGDGPQRERLSELAGDGVTVAGHRDEAGLQRALAEAVAVVATAEDEDFGLVAAEAMAAGRPVITTTDSGGLAEQVDHGMTGLVTPPLAPLIGRAVTTLAADPALADRLGRAGRDVVASRTWQPLLRLLETRPAKPRLLVLSTFPAEPVVGGGARRLRGIAGALQADREVTVLSLTNRVGPGRIERRILDDGVREVRVGRSSSQLRAESQMAALADLPVDDIACSVLHTATVNWKRTLAEELETADGVILAHPFLAPSLHTDVPVAYDAHNVEIELKAALLAGKPGHARLLEWTAGAELAAVQMASVVTATSAHDADRLRALFGVDATVVPNGVTATLDGATSGTTAASETADRDRRAAARASLLQDLGLDLDDSRPILLFVASNHQPNHDAADRIDRLAARHPEYIAVLAGAHSERPRDNAYCYGSFPEATHARLLAAADVALNPVEAGSGTNLKLIEAMAAAVPVVATPTGARGIENPEKYLVVVESHALVEGIEEALDPALSAPRVAAALALAERCTWNRSVGPLRLPLSG